MREPLPVVPPLCITSTPGTRELSRSAVFVGAASWLILAASMVPTLLPSSRFCCSSPVADTTTTSSGTAAGVSATSSAVDWPAVTLTGNATRPVTRAVLGSTTRRSPPPSFGSEPACGLFS